MQLTFHVGAEASPPYTAKKDQSIPLPIGYLCGVAGSLSFVEI